jgi:hypothetical protein
MMHLVELASDYFSEPSLRDVINKANRDIDRSNRKLEREKAESYRREKEAVRALKDRAKSTGVKVQQLRVLAMNVVRVRESRNAVETALGHVENQRGQLVTASTMAEVASVMQNASRAVGGVAASGVNPRRVAGIVANYEHTTRQMDAFSDAMEDVTKMVDADASESVDGILEQIFEEFSIAEALTMPPAPKGGGGEAHATAQVVADDLVERMQRLRDRKGDSE